MSIWTLGSFHPGWPDLRWLQKAAQVAVGDRRRACWRCSPRGRKDAVAVAALGGAALIGVQMVGALLVLPLHLLVAAGRHDRAAGAPAAEPDPVPEPLRPEPFAAG